MYGKVHQERLIVQFVKVNIGATIDLKVLLSHQLS